MRLLDLIWTQDVRLKELAEEVSVSQKQVVAQRGERPFYAYFPLDCVFSVLVDSAEGVSTEVAAIGNEGVGGLEAVLGGVMQAGVVCQVPGKTIRLRASVLSTVWQENLEVRQTIDRYAVALVGQFMQSAACNRLHSVEQRAARWLLATHDRKESPVFSLTHEFLAAMLGANRTTISLTLREMERGGLIRRKRNRIEIVDLEGLKEKSCECYEIIRRYHEDALRKRSA